jgi:hypothetical protein
MAQTKPKAAQFYGVSGDGTAGQVLISDGNGGMFWGANTEEFTVSWNTPTGQGLTYTQPSPQSSTGTPGSAFPSTTFTVTKSDTIISGTATIAGLPTGIAATQVITGSGIGNTLTVTLSGVFPGADSLNTDLTLSGLTLSKTVSWATPTGQSLTYTQPSPQSSTGNPGTTFPTTTFTATKSGEIISGTATITGLPTGITATQSLSGSGVDNILTVTLAGVFPSVDSLNTNLTISGLTIITPLTVDYLIVAGGGGGGSYYAGGGGAGGMLSGNLTIAPGTSFSTTVGGGGGWNSNGSNSIFNSITAIGGGKGGDSTSSGYSWGIGGTGGSGGGSSGKRGGGSNGTVGQGTAGQGNNGGYGVSSSFGDTGGAGGGAGAAGTSPTSAVRYTVGGIGLQSSITGSAVYYAGGGGGNGSYAGIGGAGGGASAVTNGASPNATPNTGGGGAGGNMWPSTAYTPSNGGSGIVIIRYPNGYTASVSGLGYGVLNATVSGSTDKYTTLTSGTGTISIN